VEGEAVWRVPSLSVPDTDRLPAAGELTRYDAVRLFLDRARLRRPRFDLTPANTPAVAEVCTKLEGIPLAIELATARMGTLSVWQISEKLRNPLGFLSAGRRTAVPRQQTLRGTLDWSHDLLSESERTLFCRLSVFTGGWSLEAAEAAVAGDGIAEDAVLELLSRLVDKSLVTAEIPRERGPRYTMLELVRQYAQEKLEETGEAQATRRAHAQYFLALAEEAEPKLWESGDKVWFDRLEAEHDNIRAALSWTLEHEQAELALRLGGALRWFWSARGYFSEGRRWLERALSEEGRTSAEARAKALDGVGRLASEQRDMGRVEAAAEAGLKLSEEARIEGVILADFKNLLGEAAWLRGDHERGAELFEESLVLHREARNRRGIAWSAYCLGCASSDRGDYERAKELYEEGIALAREMGGALPLGDLLMALGWELLLEGDHERATALSEEAAELYRKRGSRGALRWVLDNLGWAALLREDHERAKALYIENVALCRNLGDKMVASWSIDGLACLAASRGEAQRAARLFGAAATLREAVGYQQSPRDRSLLEPYLTIARPRLSEVAWDKGFAEGQAMSFEEAIEYALSAEELGPLPPAPEQPSTGAHQPGLTRREKEVAACVSQGLTNRQIAKELVLSERTVENHVANLLKKLGLHSREQVAASISDRQPHQPNPR
jgi:predicted ATPase/DNA-binding CsgD family transcriptional regulator